MSRVSEPQREESGECERGVSGSGCAAVRAGGDSGWGWWAGGGAGVAGKAEV